VKRRSDIITNRRKRPTQADVAQLANVSQAMVSYTLNNKSTVTVPLETRERILRAVEELHYVPDRVARSLRTRQTHTVACVIPDITNPFHPVFARGIQEIAEPFGYDLILYDTDHLAEKERKVLQALQQGRVDGVIMTALYVSPSEFLPLLELDMPVVIQGPIAMPIEVAGFPLDSVWVNNVAASRAAVMYLIDQGHTRIGMIAGQKDTPPRHDRLLGYQQALAERNILLDTQLIRDSMFTEAGGYRGMQELLALSPRPTAVFAASDLIAVGAILAIKEAGLRVPQDIAVVGFDDIPLAKLVSPALTTVAQFQAALGRRAAEMLFDRLQGTAPEIGRREELSFKLVVRESA